ELTFTDHSLTSQMGRKQDLQEDSNHHEGMLLFPPPVSQQKLWRYRHTKLLSPAL
ncbi:hypothetical protein STEG23_034695, partial [Scotinomys teguina]